MEMSITPGRSALKQVIWEEVRQETQAVNPELVQIIDDINPGSHLPLFKATYPYGGHIIKHGVLHLPNPSGELVPWNHSSIPNDTQNQLGHNIGAHPVALLLSKTIEIFFSFHNQTIPIHGLISPGTIFNTYRALNTTDMCDLSLWDVTAGARSILMLPPIAERTAHDKLCKKLNIHTPKPETLSSQWQTFKAIVNSSCCKTEWATQLLFFSDQWLKHLNDKRFIYLQRYLYVKAWEQSDHVRHQFIWHLIFSLIQQRRHIKFDPYITNTVEHLLMISIGATPGFAPATNDMAAPVSLLQNVYRDIYGLKKYQPVIFHLKHFNMNQFAQHAYYSLGYPTTIRFSPRTTKITTKLNDLICIKIIMQKYLEELRSGQYNIQKTPLSKLPEHVHYSYFHNSQNDHNIQPCQAILQKDDLLKSLVGKESVPKNSPFLQGLIGIASGPAT